MPRYFCCNFFLAVFIFPSSVVPQQREFIGIPEEQVSSELGKFREYRLKFDPTTVWEAIDKEQVEKGRNYTASEYIDLFYKGIDMTDDLLKLNVQREDAGLVLGRDGRRWVPPPGLHVYYRDKFSLRPRLWSLMKQAIYQARSKMIIMQRKRVRYRPSKLYKMGYLMSKTDNACKIFARFAMAAFRSCSVARGLVKEMVTQYDMLVLQEKLLHMWFNVDLLTDVIYVNDKLLRQSFKEHGKDVLEYWSFVP